MGSQDVHRAGHYERPVHVHDLEAGTPVGHSTLERVCVKCGEVTWEREEQDPLAEVYA